MCGICGFVGPEDRPLLKRMADAMSHRGPDDEGFYADGQASLGNRRLSIVDIAGGHMPLANEEGTVWVTFNGEIYNHKLLRGELEAAGHRFATRSDTEVLAHGYEEWGEALPGRLNGIFAFAVWDSVKRRLLLARDQMGVKPLHYASLPGGLLFASEIKSILCDPRIKRQVDPVAVGDVLNQGFIPSARTMFEGIRRLPPAHLLVHEAGKSRVERYWSPRPAPNESRDAAGYAKQLARVFRDCVAMELQGEVPQGVYLSAGVDSTALLATMRSVSDDTFHTFTVGFGESTDETDEARRTADRFGATHHELFVGSDALKHSAEAIWHLEEPRRNLEPTLLLSRLAKRHVKVVHSGLGGDEAWGGYDRSMRAHRQAPIVAAIPRPLRRLAGSLPLPAGAPSRLHRIRHLLANADDPAAKYLAFAPTGPLTPHEGRAMLVGGGDGFASTADEYRPAFQDLGGLAFQDQHTIVQMRTYMAEDLLQIVDRETAACGLEGRVPFCNRAMVEFSMTVPNEVKMASQKHVLRLAMGDLLPPEVLAAKRKRVFGMSSRHWFDGELRERAAAALTPERVRAISPVRPDFVRNVLARPAIARHEREFTQLWTLYALHLWHSVFMEGDPTRPPAERTS